MAAVLGHDGTRVAHRPLGGGRLVTRLGQRWIANMGRLLGYGFRKMRVFHMIRRHFSGVEFLPRGCVAQWMGHGCIHGVGGCVRHSVLHLPPFLFWAS